MTALRLPRALPPIALASLALAALVPAPAAATAPFLCFDLNGLPVHGEVCVDLPCDPQASLTRCCPDELIGTPCDWTPPHPCGIDGVLPVPGGRPDLCGAPCEAVGVAVAAALGPTAELSRATASPRYGGAHSEAESAGGSWAPYVDAGVNTAVCDAYADERYAQACADTRVADVALPFLAQQAVTVHSFACGWSTGGYSGANILESNLAWLPASGTCTGAGGLTVCQGETWTFWNTALGCMQHDAAALRVVTPAGDQVIVGWTHVCV